MSLTKEDLNAIKKVVTETVIDSEGRLRGEMKTMETGLQGEIKVMESGLRNEIIKAKDEVLEILGQEVSDLADINRAVITRVDELDCRLRIVERKLGLKVV